MAGSPRTLLICHHDDPISRDGLARWLAHFTALLGVIVVTEPAARTRKRIVKEYERSGVAGLCDVFLYRLYHRLVWSGHEQRFQQAALARLAHRYPLLPPGVAVLHAASPNSAAVRDFIQAHPCDLLILRCKTLLRPEIFTLPARATLVMHPGICPEYRNAHGGFWALAARDRGNVGLTLLAIDAGIDTGPVYGYYRTAFDEVTEPHTVIQNRLLLDNLERMEPMIRDIAAGRARALDTNGRASTAWGQPRLSRYLAWKWRARRDRRQGALLYHDVVERGAQESSGFPGPGANVYKLERERFDAHLAALRRAFPAGPAVLRAGTGRLARAPFVLTFDDGGISMLAVADRLEAWGWRGHFFITTARIGTPGFLGSGDIAALHRRGHVIGSHSASHPPVFSNLSRTALVGEWGDSVAHLAGIIGEAVYCASVPGGFVSRDVCETAARAGLRLLFTSEPSTRVTRVGDMQVVGRFAVRGNMSAGQAVALARAERVPHAGQWLRWNGLKPVKAALGDAYPRARGLMLGRKAASAGAREGY